MNPGGAQAEDQALHFLLGQGLKLKQRNYTCRLGEIDLILLEGATLVFVEVRMRSSRSFGGAAQSITATQTPAFARHSASLPFPAAHYPSLSLRCRADRARRPAGMDQGRLR